MSSPTPIARPHVVIVGAGFGGLTLTQQLRRAPVQVTLIDRNNHHTFQPLLYQVATAGLEPEQVAHAVRGVFQKQDNVRFRLGKVTDIDTAAQHVGLSDGTTISYDYLVLAAGATTNFFGVPGAEEHGFTLKTLDDAIKLRSHVIRQFERADQDPSLIDDGILNFVVVGGGPTGVETAGALLELFDLVLRKDFPDLPIDRTQVYLIEMTDRLLGTFDPKLSAYTRDTLCKRGVEVCLDTAVVEATPAGVRLADETFIQTNTLLWAAGIKAISLAATLGAEQVQGGRIRVAPDLSLPRTPNVFVIGDLSGSTDEDGNLHPQVAPLAIQGAKHVADVLEKRLKGQPAPAFSYLDKGSMATIGRNAAVTEIPKPHLRTTGFLAWLMWLGLHLIMLVGFRNRLQVLTNWIWNYFTYDRGPRLILGRPRATTDASAPSTPPTENRSVHGEAASASA